MPKPGDGSDRVMCSACGTWLIVPDVAGPAATTAEEKAPASAASAASAGHAKRRVRDSGRGVLWTTVAASVAVLLVGAAVVAMLMRDRRGGDGGAEAQDSAAFREQVLALKKEAEKLAIDGDLPAAHAKYQEIEKIAAGRKLDTALWDLTERAKFDQDRIFGILMSEREAQAKAAQEGPVARAAAQGSPEHAPPARQYPTSFDVMKMINAVADRQAQQQAPGATTPATRPDTAAGPVAAAADTAPPPQPATRAAAAAVAPTQPAALPVMNAASGNGGVSDEQIGLALERGVEFLLQNMKADQVALEHRSATHVEAVNALVLYSLLHASKAMRDERLNINGPLMKSLLGRVKEHLFLIETGDPPAPVTYGRSLRAAALAVYDRREDRKALEEDVKWLIAAASDGAYTYNDQTGREYNNTNNNIRRHVVPEGPDRGLYSFDPGEEFGPTPLHNGESLVPTPPLKGSRGAGTISRFTPPGTPYPNQPSTNRPGRTYQPPIRIYRELPTAVWDNSNSQYGLLGVWAGAEVGVEVPMDYWLGVERHWMNNQLQTGEWNYNGQDKRGYYGMTLAGIASLFVTHDYLDAPALGAETGREPFSPHLAYALMWLEQGDNCLRVSDPPLYFLGYNLFGLERVGLASGFKYFGKHDWYRQLAVKVVATQWPNGAWGREQQGEEAFIDTAYMVLFLSRGRHPILMNKLRFDGYWNNRSRDVANLSRFASHELERAVNWQVVPIDREWHEWLDSPVLFLASHQPPRSMSDEQYAKLRKFVDGGGLLLTHADGGSAKFNAFAEELAKRLFPEHAIANVPQDHELYGVQYKLKTKPALKAVSNGSRILMIHSPTDLTTAWQVRNGTKRELWELAVNVFVYAAGKADLRNRLSSPYVAEPTNRAQHTVKLARVRHGGTWDPEPYAWERMSRVMRRETGWAIEREVVEAKELNAHATRIAHVSGTAALALDDAQIAGIRSFVESGGVLFLDACGGSEAFTQSVHAVMVKAFPNAKLAAVPLEHPLLKGGSGGMVDLSKPQLRGYAESKVGKTLRLEILSAGKGFVVFSPLDVTTGLLGTNTWGVVGYEPGYAQNLVKNLVLWAEGRAR
jgi:hypothetical protein